VKVLDSRRVYDGRVVHLRVDQIELDDRRFEAEIVEHREAVVILARPAPGSLILVGQYRYPLERVLWEVPAGSVDDGESVEEAAARELREETGYRAKRLRRLWSAYSAPGFCNELLHFVLADDLTAGEPDPDVDEQIEVRTIDAGEAWAMVERNELPDAKTQIALAALRTLEHPR
jgi:ADP-ribose pyrophosphatase